MTGVEPAPLVVAIDGPSGSGKSTIAKRVAAAHRLAYLDTGAMYRAATWWCLDQGVDLADTDAVAQQVRGLPLVIGTNPANPTFVVGDRDVTTQIRDTSISTQVSAVATNLSARPILQQWQRDIIAVESAPGGFSEGRGIVAEGRDITTVIAPGARVRILLLADEQARLARRSRELHGNDDAAALAATSDQVLRRDADDSRVSNFATAADGVFTVDTSELTLEDAVRAVADLIEENR